MSIENVINELKKYITKNENRAEKRIADTCEVSIDNGYAGVIDNEFIGTNKHEVYIFIQSKDDIVVPLLYKLYNTKEEAEKYYITLKDLISTKNLDKIREEVVN